MTRDERERALASYYAAERHAGACPLVAIRDCGGRAMKFDILNHYSGKVQFTAEIDCSESASTSVKIGLAVKCAIKARAYLADAELAGADLAGAYLARADLAGAYLAGAYLARAYLADANL